MDRTTSIILGIVLVLGGLIEIFFTLSKPIPDSLLGLVFIIAGIYFFSKRGTLKA